MKLTLYTHHALRVLGHLAQRPGRLSSIHEIARTYGMSPNHLMKVVQDLRTSGFVEAVRGRSGGIRLARPARKIMLGELVLHTERTFGWTDETGRGADRLGEIFQAAFGSFVKALDTHSVEEIAKQETAGAHPSARGKLAH